MESNICLQKILPRSAHAPAQAGPSSAFISISPNLWESFETSDYGTGGKCPVYISLYFLFRLVNANKKIFSNWFTYETQTDTKQQKMVQLWFLQLCSIWSVVGVLVAGTIEVPRFKAAGVGSRSRLKKQNFFSGPARTPLGSGGSPTFFF